MCLGEKKIAIVLQIKKSDNWFRFAHLQPTKTRRTTTITALDLPNLNDLKIFYSLQDLSPTTGGPVLNEGDNKGDFDDLLLGNIVVGLKPGPTNPTTSTSKTAIIDAKDVLDDPDLPPVPLFLEKENEDDFDLQSPVAEILGLRPTAK